MDHCIAAIRSIVDRGTAGPREIFQLGYNLGRLSELTGLGREPFWDSWKDAVSAWDLDRMGKLAQELPIVCGVPPIISPVQIDDA